MELCDVVSEGVSVGVAEGVSVGEGVVDAEGVWETEPMDPLCDGMRVILRVAVRDGDSEELCVAV